MTTTNRAERREAGKRFVHNRALKLVFEDPALDGLEVRMRSLSLGQFLELAELFGHPGLGIDELRELFEAFADALIEWNLDDEDGTEVPTTVDGVLSQDSRLMRQIIDAWGDAMTGVHGPLAERSPNGEQFPEASIPMAPLSESPPS